MRKRSVSIGEAIRRLRLAKKLTQTELAGEAFSKSYISQLERGNVTPSLRAIEVIAARLGVTPAWLMERSQADQGELLRAASVAYHLGDLDHASQLLAKAERQAEEMTPPLLWELHLLRIRLAASREAWNEVLQACRELQQAVSEGAAPPEWIAIPHHYWWGYAWLSLGNQRQAVRRWEQGLESVRVWSLEAEALYLMAHLIQLYQALGDEQSARSVRTRLRAATSQLDAPFDLSRWVMARFSEASRFPLLPDMGEALCDAEAWARAGRALRAAAELRAELEALPLTPERSDPGESLPRRGRRRAGASTE